MIYFDNSATTKPYKEVVDTFAKVSTEFFGNPSSLHSLGKSAERLLLQARESIADLLGVKGKEIIFTSGGTEGNNIAIKGVARNYKQRGMHIITSMADHSATKQSFKQLEEEGFKVTFLRPNKEGVVTKEQVEQAITDETILVSLIHVNNEVGSIFPIEEIGHMLAKYRKIFFHVDHVQGLGKVPLSMQEAKIDLCSISAHKFHGLNGTGALYVRDGIRLHSLFTGGGQEANIRPGTENLAGSVSMAKALRLSLEKSVDGISSIKEITDYLREQLGKIEGVFINSPENGAPHILNISVPGVKPEVIIQALAKKEVYVSSQSACSSKKQEPSIILMEMGLGEARATSAIRISLSYENTLEEAKQFIDIFSPIVKEIQKVVN